MPQRRKVFDSHYGSAKAQQGKGGAKLPPPQGGPPVPLPVSAESGIGPAPLPGQGAAPRLDQGGLEGQGTSIDMLLQQLLAQFGGANG